MEEVLAFGAFCFVSLFAVVEPLGIMPMYISMTSGLSPHHQRRVAKRACLVAFLTLFIFSLTGQLIFRFFGISVESMKVVGGVIFFLIGYEMLQAKHSRTAFEERADGSGGPVDQANDMALTPLGIPMIAGPGAIANVIVLWNEAEGFGKRVALLVGMTLVILTTLLVLLGARRIARFLGDSGNKVLLRLMGLITMVIAVEFFFAGLTPIVRRMINPA
jgi:multiple antibiotic resistance protein